MLNPSSVGTRVECVRILLRHAARKRERKGFAYSRQKILEKSDETWLIPGKRTKCYEKNEAENVLWDAVEEANCSQCKPIEEFRPKKFNKDCEGGWRKEVEVDYGI